MTKKRVTPAPSVLFRLGPIEQLPALVGEAHGSLDLSSTRGAPGGRSGSRSRGRSPRWCRGAARSPRAGNRRLRRRLRRSPARHCWRCPWPAVQVLQRAFHLLRLALELGLHVSRRAPESFLHLAAKVLGAAGQPVFVHGCSPRRDDEGSTARTGVGSASRSTRSTLEHVSVRCRHRERHTRSAPSPALAGEGWGGGGLHESSCVPPP